MLIPPSPGSCPLSILMTHYISFPVCLNSFTISGDLVLKFYTFFLAVLLLFSQEQSCSWYAPCQLLLSVHWTGLISPAIGILRSLPWTCLSLRTLSVQFWSLVYPRGCSAMPLFSIMWLFRALSKCLKIDQWTDSWIKSRSLFQVQVFSLTFMNMAIF